MRCGSTTGSSFDQMSHTTVKRKIVHCNFSTHQGRKEGKIERKEYIPAATTGFDELSLLEAFACIRGPFFVVIAASFGVGRALEESGSAAGNANDLVVAF